MIADVMMKKKWVSPRLSGGLALALRSNFMFRFKPVSIIDPYIIEEGMTKEEAASSFVNFIDGIKMNDSKWYNG